MISREDCIALGSEEIEAICEHEHLPEVAAAALARYLLNTTGRAALIQGMIVDDIHAALDKGQVSYAADLFAALRHFIAENPGVCASRQTH